MKPSILRELTFSKSHVIFDIIGWIIQEIVKFRFYHAIKRRINGVALGILESIIINN